MNDRTAPLVVAAWTSLHSYVPSPSDPNACLINGPLVGKGETIAVPGYVYAQNESMATVYVRVLAARMATDTPEAGEPTTRPPLLVRLIDKIADLEDDLEARFRWWMRNYRIARMQRIAKKIDEGDGRAYATRIVVARPDGVVDWFSTDIAVDLSDVLYAVRKRETRERMFHTQ